MNRFSEILHAIGEWLRRVVTQPRSELNRWQRTVRFAYDLGRYGANQLREDNAPQMAGALSFRTLFGLLPVLVVGTVVVRAFSGLDQLDEWVADLCRKFGLDELKVSDAASVAGGEGQDVGAGGQTLSDWVLDLVGQIDNINFAAIGWVGLAVLAYSAIGLMVTIEKSFNTVYRAPAGRSWLSRVLVYWTVLTLGPLALGLTDFLYARSLSWFDATETWQWVLAAGPFVWRFCTMWLFMAVIYKLIPNTTVSLRPALIGAFVTAVLLEIGRQSLGEYLQNMVSLRYLYSSLGLIPLFMFWVYLMWLVVLFGLEVAAMLQMLRGRRVDELETKQQLTGLVDPTSVVLVMEVIAEDFRDGHATTGRSVAERTGIPESTLERILGRLIEAGLLHRIAEDEKAVTLARPAEQIGADQLVEIGYAMVQSGAGARRSELVQRLRAVQKSVAAELKLGVKPVPTGDR